MMRLASVLLVLVLLTTCGVSGTFAKYITRANGGDEAQVAKWGVKVGIGGALFGEAYNGEGSGNSITEVVENEDDEVITVQTLQNINVVAPGTKNENGITFILTGQPEVDTQITIDVTDGSGNAPVDVVLPAGEGYTDYTIVSELNEDNEPVYNEQFDLPEAYHPLVFTLSSGDYTMSGTLEEIAEVLEGISGIYHTNTDLSTIEIDGKQTNGTYTLTWEWTFSGMRSVGEGGPGAEGWEAIGSTDQPDTYLANIIAGDVELPEGASTGVSLGISITAEQVD